MEGKDHEKTPADTPGLGELAPRTWGWDSLRAPGRARKSGAVAQEAREGSWGTAPHTAGAGQKVRVSGKGGRAV